MLIGGWWLEARREGGEGWRGRLELRSIGGLSSGGLALPAASGGPGLSAIRNHEPVVPVGPDLSVHHLSNMRVSPCPLLLSLETGCW